MVTNLRKVQLACVKVLEDIDGLCRKYGIEYSLTGGSVIGYHLYGGFIPWDDDIDIVMTRENYERFLMYANQYLPSHYSLENFENGKDRRVIFSKVVDKNTTVVELKQDNRKYVTGVFVDVTVLDFVPTNKIKKRLFLVLSKMLQCCRDRTFENEKSFRTLVKNIGIVVMRPFARPFYRLCKNLFTGEKQSGSLAELFAGIPNEYEKKIFDEYVDVEFEGKKMRLVKDYMSYLERRYGKREFYKQPKKGDAPHHLIYANTSLPYERFLKNRRRSR